VSGPGRAYGTCTDPQQQGTDPEPPTLTQTHIAMPPTAQLITLLFLMLGPFKILGPYAKITMNSTPVFSRQIAIRATLYASAALLLAGMLGQRILSNYDIPLPFLKLTAGFIFFLVALLAIIQQFNPPPAHVDGTTTPTLGMAMTPLAFPTIVTPYGIAAVIVFIALSPDTGTKMKVAGVVVGIMALNLLVMLISRPAFKVLALILPILAAVLGIVQVAMGLFIMHNSLKEILSTW
jgi:multiple antibiotic resistance protein